MAGPVAQTSESAYITTDPACLNSAATDPVSDDKAASETSTDQSSKQYRTITSTYGKTRTVVADLDEVRKVTQICFPVAPQIHRTTVGGVLSS